MYLIITPVLQAFFGQHDNIEPSQHILSCTETFTYQTFDAVALYRLGNALLGNRQTQARVFPVIAACQDREQLITGSDRIVEYLLEFIAV